MAYCVPEGARLAGLGIQAITHFPGFVPDCQPNRSYD